MLRALPADPMPQRSLDAAALRARLAADLAAGRTVSLSAADLADPEVRRDLPRLLEELTAQQSSAVPPMRVHGYTLLGEIGQGGMSTVHLARQVALDRHVALKIAPKWLTGDRRTHQRLLQEARAMARLSHPNIVTIHDILEVDGTVAIAMDWVDGLTLAAILKALPPEPSDGDLDRVHAALGGVERSALGTNAMRFFVRVVRDVARAVDHVHRSGLLHLDVKPSNILLRRDGTPLLADFGVVREIDLDASHTRTFAGTPVYAAPEQLERKDHAFGAHTDVYGLGMTLYEMLARVQPLRQLGLTRVLHDVMAGRIPPLGARTAVPPDLANIVHKAIAPEPGHRYATAAELADDLTAFLEHRPVTARPLTRVQRLRRWARVEPWKAVLAAVLLVTVPVVAGLGLYLWLQLPRIERMQREEQRAEASQLKHEAFQAYFVKSKPEGEPSRLLRRAMARDPGASSLACLLAMAHEEGDTATAALLAEHRDQVDAHLGLRLFAAKVAAHRPFFAADETDRLRASVDPIDKYVLALDRVFVAEDSLVEETWEDAVASLQEAVLVAGPDPLLYGLLAWNARRLGPDGRYPAIERAIRARWADDVSVMAWLFYSQQVSDSAAALAVADELRARAPAHPHCWEMFVGEAERRRDHATALQRLALADAAGVRSPALEMFRLHALVARDGKPVAERALRELPGEQLTTMRRLFLLRVVDPAAAAEQREQLLRGELRSASLASWLFKAAAGSGRADESELAWQRWRTDHPDRRLLHWDRFGVLLERRDAVGATRLVAELELPRRTTAKQWRSICTMVISAHDWRTLARCARRWLDHGAPEHAAEASFYAAIASLRQDPSRTDEPRRLLAVATTANGETAQWYALALLESAWLRVCPGAAAAWRDPRLAQCEVEAFDAFFARVGRPHDGPWNLLVRAEVAFANGRARHAIELAERASANHKREAHAPADCAALIAAALARYRE